MEDFLIFTDTNLIQTDYVVNYLSNDSYWAKGRNPYRIKTAIKNSFCFGVYIREKQIGFVRVVTDLVVFTWVMDVFIQGKGIGKELIEHIINHKKLQTISRWGLNTLDAHELYNQYGFKKLQNPDMYMEKLIKQE